MCGDEFCVCTDCGTDAELTRRRLRISQHDKAEFEDKFRFRSKLLYVPLVGGLNFFHLRQLYHVVFVHGIECERIEIWHDVLLAGLCHYGQLCRHLGGFGSAELHHQQRTHVVIAKRRLR